MQRGRAERATETQVQPSRVLVAPDSFKGSFDARTVAEAIGRGLRRGAASLECEICPLADGGEGTLQALLVNLGGRLEHADAHDPLGRPIRAAYGVLGDGATAVIETATASGLGLLSPQERDAWRASSAGTGELIVAAVASGARTVLVACGGSATTDGGAGAIGAIEAAGGLRGARLVLLCDVRVPFEQAAAVFARQKGADEATVRALTARLDALSATLPRDPRGIPMGGCAGGLSGGLWAAFDAALVPGATWVLDAIGFDVRLADATAVITGEGRLDAQTLHGKLVCEIAGRAAAAHVPVRAVVGQDALSSEDRHGLRLRSVTVASTIPEIEAAGEAIGRRLL